MDNVPPDTRAWLEENGRMPEAEQRMEKAAAELEAIFGTVFGPKQAAKEAAQLAEIIPSTMLVEGQIRRYMENRRAILRELERQASEMPPAARKPFRAAIKVVERITKPAIPGL
ncbi:hypothetical protein BH23GEM7_BH23GEM7_27160 [soil metagenome]